MIPENPKGGDRSISRRQFIKSTATGVVVSSGGIAAAAQNQQPLDPNEPIELAGQASGWQGQAPQSIEGRQNPTLQLQEGEIYTVRWTNIDGQPYTFTVQNNQENSIKAIQQLQGTTTDNKAIPQSKTVKITNSLSEQDESQTLRFEATPEIAFYRCTVHPSSMVGEVRVQS
ncbi:hypothetical protein ACFFQF_16600 [Haladaptatus pallidirubidus]|uniref:Blue (type 1) copper domain-containing protein n=1 Tax=Haladaptatus pallidirubidus TaxID=1008152 RepID=A0AAV3URR8_9EURY|nr:hypothetical protein [Haladaptatus pallidirubidus]